MVAPPGFEPGSRDPKSRMLGRYTTGLPIGWDSLELINLKSMGLLPHDNSGRVVIEKFKTFGS